MVLIPEDAAADTTPTISSQRSLDGGEEQP
jgi:hypothetical protein